MKEKELLCTVGGSVTGTVESSIEVPQEIRTTIGSNNSIPGYLSEENDSTNSKGYLHPHVHCSIITVAKPWKQPKCPSMNE